MAKLGAAAQTVTEILQKVAERGETVNRDVSSSAIENIGYMPLADMMTIRFANRDAYPTYEYPDVDLVDVAKFMAAQSKGRHYHKWIKPYYGIS